MTAMVSREALAAAVAERYRRTRERKIGTYYPDTGPLRRELYPKHLKFFEAGSRYRERMMMAANRVGKTEGVGGYELVLHLTGEYPSWWTGRRFNRPIKAWAAGDTGKTVRDILQEKLLGPLGDMGTGLIPKTSIVKVMNKAGIADAVEIIMVKHIHGGVSRLTLKSYDQRREAFQGTEQDVILLDEEPPLDVYTECLMRTMTNNGLVMLTFTPLMGMSEVVLSFLPGGKMSDVDPEIDESSSKFSVMASWDDVPHLTESSKKQLLESIPSFQRDSRSRGIPQLGSGAIYPVQESEIIVPDFAIPKHWPRGFALDVGWNRTAAIWGAHDRDSDTIYLYSEHYRSHAEPAVHAEAIKGRGKWIPGCIDPAARGRSQRDGEQLMQQYVDLGLPLVTAINAKEAGIYNVWQRLSYGKMKVSKSLSNWLSEFRLYRRDEKGQVVKVNDHLMDCTRYLSMTASEIMITEPFNKEPEEDSHIAPGGHAWMS